MKADELCVNCRTIMRRGSHTGETRLNVIEDVILFGCEGFIVVPMFGFVSKYCIVIVIVLVLVLVLSCCLISLGRAI